jgi:hypothetical protein
MQWPAASCEDAQLMETHAMMAEAATLTTLPLLSGVNADCFVVALNLFYQR